MSRIISSPSKYIQGKNELSKLRTYTFLSSNQDVYVLIAHNLGINCHSTC